MSVKLLTEHHLKLKRRQIVRNLMLRLILYSQIIAILVHKASHIGIDARKSFRAQTTKEQNRMHISLV